MVMKFILPCISHVDELKLWVVARSATADGVVSHVTELAHDSAGVFPLEVGVVVSGLCVGLKIPGFGAQPWRPCSSSPHKTI